jgi:hypothetical protein
MLPGPLVLGAVGPLHSVHTDARRRDDAQREHQQTKDPSGPRVGCSDHHDQTIGAPTINRKWTTPPR